MIDLLVIADDHELDEALLLLTLHFNVSGGGTQTSLIEKW